MTSSVNHALILGGTSGLGLQLAIQCLKRGITPIIMGRQIHGISQIPQLNGAETFELDLRATERFPELLVELSHLIASRRVSHLFWVAGIRQPRPFLELDGNELSRLIGVHLNGPFRVIQAILRELRGFHQPVHFVVISSTSAYKQRAGEEVYCALKAAKSMFARQMAGTLRDQLPGSEVTLVMPGGMETPFWEGSVRSPNTKYMDPSAVAEIIADLTMSPDRQIDVNRNFQSVAIERAIDGTPVPTFRHLNDSNIY